MKSTAAVTAPSGAIGNPPFTFRDVDGDDGSQVL